MICSSCHKPHDRTGQLPYEEGERTFHVTRETGIAAWLDLGWIDLGPAHLPGWNILEWPEGAPVPAPFRAPGTRSAGDALRSVLSVEVELNLPSNVYLVAESPEGLIKVGVADNIKARLVSLQIGNPRPLNVVASWRTPTKWTAFKIERKTLRSFSHARATGEWLKIDPDRIRNFIDPLVAETASAVDKYARAS